MRRLGLQTDNKITPKVQISNTNCQQEV